MSNILFRPPSSSVELAPAYTLALDAANRLLAVSLLPIEGKGMVYTLDALKSIYSLLTQDISYPVGTSNGALWKDKEGEWQEVNYIVLKSSHANNFHLGGDLGYFLDCANRKDDRSLLTYVMLSAVLTAALAEDLSGNCTTIALVQGNALGGGFETALATNYIIAEEHSRFGLPEIASGLFPVSGALQLLSRRIPVRQALNLASSGKLYSARELLDMGVVDEVCPSKTGEAAVASFIAKRLQNEKPQMALQRAASRLYPPLVPELEFMAKEWVQTALALPPQKRRVLDLISRLAQTEKSK